MENYPVPTLEPSSNRVIPIILIFYFPFMILCFAFYIFIRHTFSVEQRPTLIPTQIKNTAVITLTYTPTSTETSTPTQTIVPSPTNTATLAPFAMAIVQPASVNLRAGPGKTFKVLGIAKKGESLPVYSRSEDGTWLQIGREEQLWVSASVVQVDQEIANLPVAPTATLTATLTRVPTRTPIPVPKRGEPAYYGCKTEWFKESITEMKMCVKSVTTSQSIGGYRASSGDIIVAINIFVLGDTSYDEKLAADYFHLYQDSGSGVFYYGSKIINCDYPMSDLYDCRIKINRQDEITVLVIVPQEFSVESAQLQFASSNKVNLPTKK